MSVAIVEAGFHFGSESAQAERMDPPQEPDALYKEAALQHGRALSDVLSEVFSSEESSEEVQAFRSVLANTATIAMLGERIGAHLTASAVERTSHLVPADIAVIQDFTHRALRGLGVVGDGTDDALERSWDGLVAGKRIDGNMSDRGLHLALDIATRRIQSALQSEVGTLRSSVVAEKIDAGIFAGSLEAVATLVREQIRVAITKDTDPVLAVLHYPIVEELGRTLDVLLKAHNKSRLDILRGKSVRIGQNDFSLDAASVIDGSRTRTLGDVRADLAIQLQTLLSYQAYQAHEALVPLTSAEQATLLLLISYHARPLRDRVSLLITEPSLSGIGKVLGKLPISMREALFSWTEVSAIARAAQHQAWLETGIGGSQHRSLGDIFFDPVDPGDPKGPRKPNYRNMLLAGLAVGVGITTGGVLLSPPHAASAAGNQQDAGPTLTPTTDLIPAVGIRDGQTVVNFFTGPGDRGYDVAYQIAAEGLAAQRLIVVDHARRYGVDWYRVQWTQPDGTVISGWVKTDRRVIPNAAAKNSPLSPVEIFPTNTATPTPTAFAEVGLRGPINAFVGPDGKAYGGAILQISAGTTLDIVGRNRYGNWLLVRYSPDAPAVWVARTDAVLRNASIYAVPIVPSEDIPATFTRTPTPTGFAEVRPNQNGSILAYPGPDKKAYGDAVTQISAGTTLDIVGRNRYGNWLLVIYSPDAPPVWVAATDAILHNLRNAYAVGTVSPAEIPPTLTRTPRPSLTPSSTTTPRVLGAVATKPAEGVSVDPRYAEFQKAHPIWPANPEMILWEPDGVHIRLVSGIRLSQFDYLRGAIYVEDCRLDLICADKRIVLTQKMPSIDEAIQWAQTWRDQNAPGANIGFVYWGSTSWGQDNGLTAIFVRIY